MATKNHRQLIYIDSSYIHCIGTSSLYIYIIYKNTKIYTKMHIEDVYKYTQKMDTEIHRRWIQRRQILTNLEARQVLYTCQVMLQFQLLSTNDFLYQFQLVQISYYYQNSYQYSTQVIEAWSACHTGMFVHNRLSHSLFSHVRGRCLLLANFPHSSRVR